METLSEVHRLPAITNNATNNTLKGKRFHTGIGKYFFTNKGHSKVEKILPSAVSNAETADTFNRTIDDYFHSVGYH